MFGGFSRHSTAEPAENPMKNTQDRRREFPLFLCEFGDLPAPSHGGAVKKMWPHLFYIFPIPHNRMLPEKIQGRPPKITRHRPLENHQGQAEGEVMRRILRSWMRGL
jgi:hypothetical protein